MYLGYRPPGGKVLLWSVKSGFRWVTRKLFSRGHLRLLYKDKSVVKINLPVSELDKHLMLEEKSHSLGNKKWTLMREYLKRDDIRKNLKELFEGIEATEYEYRTGIPIDFVLVPLFVILIPVFLIVLMIL